MWVYFWALYSVPLICVAAFMPVPCCCDYYGLRWRLIPGSVIPPGSFSRWLWPFGETIVLEKLCVSPMAASSGTALPATLRTLPLQADGSADTFASSCAVPLRVAAWVQLLALPVSRFPRVATHHAAVGGAWFSSSPAVARKTVTPQAFPHLHKPDFFYRTLLSVVLIVAVFLAECRLIQKWMETDRLTIIRAHPSEQILNIFTS